MKKIDLVASATVYDTVSELPSDIQLLMNKAIEARSNAYAPYSKFSVGAALLLENNQIILGNNQENAAYPSGMCAEDQLGLVEHADKHCLNTKSIRNNPLKFTLWVKLEKL
jgi:hypothetical protein